MAKHPLLVSFDDLLKEVGQTTKRVHDLSISDRANRSSWNGVEDQLVAVISLVSGIRSQSREILDKSRLSRRSDKG
jgi:hypothetical protein